MLKDLRQLETLGFYMCEVINYEGIPAPGESHGLKISPYLQRTLAAQAATVRYGRRPCPPREACQTGDVRPLWARSERCEPQRVDRDDRIARVGAERPRFHRCGPQRPG